MLKPEEQAKIDEIMDCIANHTGEPISGRTLCGFVQGDVKFEAARKQICYFFSRMPLKCIELFMEKYHLTKDEMGKAYLSIPQFLRSRANVGFDVNDWLVRLDPDKECRL